MFLLLLFPPPLDCLSRRAYLSAVVIILLLFPAANFGAKPPLTHFLGPFDSTDVPLLNVVANASVHLNALQITPDSAGSDSLVTLPNNSGRVFWKEPFTLWQNGKNGKLASFNTSFLINVFRPQNATPGEGLAFLIASDTALPLNSYGQYLGLTNSSTDGKPTNGFVAVELDTVKQDFDPDDNHLGLNINSVVSNITVPLSPLGFQIAPIGTQLFVLWVEYDGGRRQIEIYMAPQSKLEAPVVLKPAKPLLKSTLDLKTIVSQNSYFGFSASTGVTVELNCVLRWNISIDDFNKKDDGHTLEIGLGVGFGLLVLIVAVIGGFLYWKMLKKKNIGGSDSQILGTLKSLPGTPREFNYVELKKATNNFDEKHKLGQGGYGVVYRGTLPKEKLEVAVKMFSRDKMKSTDDFLAELIIINRLRHKHLVKLQGWCHKNGVLLLVYDYMPNGSLDNHIFCEEGGTSTTPLSWHLRYKIISGVASALNYLHNEYDQKVVHRDLKASNIMLDSEFNAKLGDFGLARALENEKISYTELEGVHGTMGYIAPECFHTGKATRESDVYGFGAVLLEVVCGQRPWTKIEGYQFLVDWVWHLHREGRILDAVDKRLGEEYEAEEAERILKLGLACSHPMAGDRPQMQTIVQILSGSVPVPHVPPFKPSFVWPSVDLASLASTFTTMTTEYTPMKGDTQSSSGHVEYFGDSSPV